jgi:uncharacterized membrane protein YhaH (DUF805 family)
MSRTRRALEGVHIACLSLWLGALLMSGATAATVFPTMRGLDPRLPGFIALPGEHASIAGGQVMARVFVLTDAVALLCFVLAAATLAAARWRAWRRLGMAQAGILAALLCTIAVQRASLAPRMRAEMTAYWDAAAAGDLDAAQRHRAAFDAAHPLASRLMGLQAGLLAVAVAAACIGLAHPREPGA